MASVPDEIRFKDWADANKRQQARADAKIASNEREIERIRDPNATNFARPGADSMYRSNGAFLLFRHPRRRYDYFVRDEHGNTLSGEPEQVAEMLRELVSGERRGYAKLRGKKMVKLPTDKEMIEKLHKKSLRVGRFGM